MQLQTHLSSNHESTTSLSPWQDPCMIRVLILFTEALMFSDQPILEDFLIESLPLCLSMFSSTHNLL